MSTTMDVERSAWTWSFVGIAALLVLHFLLRPLLVQLPIAPNLLVGALLLALQNLRALESMENL